MVFSKDWSSTSNLRNKLCITRKRKIASILSFVMIGIVVGTVVAAVLLSNVFTQTITIYQASDQLQLSLEEQPLPGESIGGIQLTTVIENDRIKDSIVTFYWHVNITHVTDPLIAADVAIDVDFFYTWPGNSYLNYLPPPPPTFTAIGGVLTWVMHDTVGFENVDIGDHDPLWLELKLTWSTDCPSGAYEVTVYVTDTP